MPFKIDYLAILPKKPNKIKEKSEIFIACLARL
jgi:hypothetical protein